MSLPAFADEADEALALARRTFDYVAKSVPEAKLKPYARELKQDAEWLASETNVAYRAGIVREIAQLRRRILFLHPDLQFDRLLCAQRGNTGILNDILRIKAVGNAKFYKALQRRHAIGQRLGKIHHTLTSCLLKSTSLI